jgi:hypothetical protein
VAAFAALLPQHAAQLSPQQALHASPQHAAQAPASADLTTHADFTAATFAAVPQHDAQSAPQHDLQLSPQQVAHAARRSDVSRTTPHDAAFVATRPQADDIACLPAQHEFASAAGFTHAAVMTALAPQHDAQSSPQHALQLSPQHAAHADETADARRAVPHDPAVVATVPHVADFAATFAQPDAAAALTAQQSCLAAMTAFPAQHEVSATATVAQAAFAACPGVHDTSHEAPPQHVESFAAMAVPPPKIIAAAVARTNAGPNFANRVI